MSALFTVICRLIEDKKTWVKAKYDHQSKLLFPTFVITTVGLLRIMKNSSSAISLFLFNINQLHKTTTCTVLFPEFSSGNIHLGISEQRNHMQTKTTAPKPFLEEVVLDWSLTCSGQFSLWWECDLASNNQDMLCILACGWLKSTVEWIEV